MERFFRDLSARPLIRTPQHPVPRTLRPRHSLLPHPPLPGRMCACASGSSYSLRNSQGTEQPGRNGNAFDLPFDSPGGVRSLAPADRGWPAADPFRSPAATIRIRAGARRSRVDSGWSSGSAPRTPEGTGRAPVGAPMEGTRSEGTPGTRRLTPPGSSRVRGAPRRVRVTPLRARACLGASDTVSGTSRHPMARPQAGAPRFRRSAPRIRAPWSRIHAGWSGIQGGLPTRPRTPNGPSRGSARISGGPPRSPEGCGGCPAGHAACRVDPARPPARGSAPTADPGRLAGRARGPGVDMQSIVSGRTRGSRGAAGNGGLPADPGRRPAGRCHGTSRDRLGDVRRRPERVHLKRPPSHGRWSSSEGRARSGATLDRSNVLFWALSRILGGSAPGVLRSENRIRKYL